MPKNKKEKQGVSEIVSDGRSSMEERFLASISGEAARNLKILRVYIGASAKELSDLSGVSHSVLRTIESGQRPLLIHQAMAIAKATGVDAISLLNSKHLLEWGGGKQYSDDSYKAWKETGREPTSEQESNGRKMLENIANYLANGLEAGSLGDLLMSTHIYVLLGGVEPEVLYAGIS
ncbi:MAG: helix-turn-helix transcriptional regulator [Verrucomicrobiales bacterium]|nr:helix-turn-helix transcriptional regulator [Verrucomicrobiales bacterium]